MAGIDTSTLGANLYYGMYNTGLPATSSSSSVFDVAGATSAAKTQANELLNSLKSSKESVKTLKADTANYLDKYTLSMKTLGQSADAVRNDNLDRLLYDRTTGEITDKTVGKTVDAVQKMVTSYNDTLKLLNDNVDRGPGTEKQLVRMVTDPAPSEGMEMVGITVNKDGTLNLDTEKLTAALKDQNPNQVALFKDIIGGFGGIADGIHTDAVRGSNLSARDLIQNDLANIQTNQNEGNPFKEMFSSIKGNVYALNNQMATGLLMNMLV